MTRRLFRLRRRRSWMWQSAILFALILVGLIVALWTGPGPAGPTDATSECSGTALCYTATVHRIVDGDTLDIGEWRVRLALVDTPEKGETGYEAAKGFAASVCPVGSQAFVDEDDGQTQGSFGRIIALVRCGERNLNAEVLNSGHAVLATEFCSTSEFATQEWASGCP